MDYGRYRLSSVSAVVISESSSMGSSASLDRHPNTKNWVEVAGELPAYVREIARSIEKTGKTLSSAIAIAISRIKVWASGKGVSAQVQAKASKALAEWEALKSKSQGKKTVKASVYGELDELSDKVQLTPFEDLLIQCAVSREEVAREVSLSRVMAVLKG